MNAANNLVMTPESAFSTHEQFLASVREIVVVRLNEKEAGTLRRAKLAYGWGHLGRRGTCFYESWEHSSPTEFIEICACGEESTIQLAGTTIHELAHCLAGSASGH